MEIEKNKIRLLFYICTISIVLVSVIVLSVMFIRFSNEQATKKLDQLVSSVYDMKKLYIEDIVNSTIQDIDIERDFMIQENYEHIDTLKAYIEGVIAKEDTIDRLYNHIKDDGISYDNIEIWFYNKTYNRVIYQLNSTLTQLEYEGVSELEEKLSEAYIFDNIQVEGYSIYLCINKQGIEEHVQDYIKNLIREKRYLDDGYVWVNQVTDYAGGDDYAIRLVHPNLPETEGTLLSTNTTDIKGSTPYQTELDGINESGELFYEYFFKKMNSEDIAHKLSYAKLYKPYDWIVATGIYLDDIDNIISQETAEIKTLQHDYIVKILIFSFFCLIGAVILVIIFEKLISKLILRFQKILEEKNEELVREKETIEKIAYLDPLTSLLNRRAMMKQLEVAFSRANRYQESFTVVIGDIDHFKKVNDRYGHIAGDLVIKTIADIMKENVRSDDYVSRWGGEEFLLLLNYSDDQSAIKNITRINEVIRKTNIIFEDQEIKCTISYGVATYKESNKSIIELIKKADQLLYDAKNTGRNRIRSEG